MEPTARRSEPAGVSDAAIERDAAREPHGSPASDEELGAVVEAVPDVTPPDDAGHMEPTARRSEPAGVSDAAIERVAAALTDVSVRGSSEHGADLRHRLVVLERMARMVEAAVVGVVAECQRTAAFFDDGHVSVRNWVAGETNTASADALARARVARLAAACPQVTEALSAGRVGVAQVRELGRARANPRIGEQVEDVVDELLAEAASMPLHGFVELVRAWEALVDADGAHRDHERAHADRRLHTSGRDGEPGGELWARLGADQFAEVTEILDAYGDAELDADVAAVRDDPDAPLPRTPDQRRADALVQALRDAAASKAPAADSVPTINYIIAADVFDEQVAALIEQRTPDFDTTSLRLRMCATLNGVPVDPATVVAAALVGHIRRIVVDHTGRIIDVGRRRRTFTGAAREAALIQALIDSGDGRCLWPGCGRRRQCQVDHTEEWQHGGLTALANAALLCPRHNRHKSRGYGVWRDSAGHWHVHRPDGSEIGPVAA